MASSFRKTGGMEYDVLIVGGGLVGCATAWHLARAGVRTLLIEATFLNAGASGKNAGSLHFQIERRFLEQGEQAAIDAQHIVALNRMAIEEWASLESEMARPLGIAMHGGLMVAESDDDLALLQFKAGRERALGLNTELLDAAAVHAMAPYLAPSVAGAAFLSSEGHANPRILTDAFAAAAMQEGCEIRTGTRLERLKMVSDGSFLASIERNGLADTVAAGRVMLATGAWTTRIAEAFGLHIPLYPVALGMNVTDRAPPLLPYLLQHVGKRLSLKQADDGNFLIGGGWAARFARTPTGGIDLDAPPSPLHEHVQGNLAAAVSILPALAHRNLIRSWTGITCISADQLPVVGASRVAPGLFFAAGGSMFTLAPIIARQLAQQIAGDVSASDAMYLFRPDRFAHLNAFSVLP